MSDRAPSAKPWWERVNELKTEGKLEEAIAVVQRDGDIAEALLVEARLHAECMRRALTDRNIDAARESWRKARGCAISYAASASSGGEGLARSTSRDRVLAELGPEPLTL